MKGSLVAIGLVVLLLGVLPHVVLSMALPWAKPGSEIAILPGLLAIPVALLSLPLLAFSRTRRVARVAAIASWALVIGTWIGVSAGHELRMSRFARAAANARPLVAAIRSFEAAHGHPPEVLSDVIPEYLEAMPEGLPPLRLVTGEKARTEYAGNEWTLVADVGIGFLNWDQFLYFPLQNYPAQGYGGWLEPVGEWAYVHE